MTIPCIGYGVGMTCRSILAGGIAAGYKAELHTSRYDPDPRVNIPVRAVLPQISRLLPYARLKGVTDAILHSRYLASLRDGDVAYLWPSVPLSVFEAIRKRGNPIIVEAVNTRMAVAKQVLDRAYRELGIEPTHGITDDRVREQAARFALCDGIFTPSPATEAALAGTPLESRTIRSSYGTWLPPESETGTRRYRGDPVTFLFLGSVCVRKGCHHLLETWRRMPRTAVLRLVGNIEPALERAYADVLDQENVVVSGFTRDVAREYRSADVFVLPSLEEGDSIACYEAASFGLPIIASAAGAGRIGADTDAIRIVDTSDIDAFYSVLSSFAALRENREEWSLRVRAAVRNYDWSIVGARSFAALGAYLARLPAI